MFKDLKIVELASVLAGPMVGTFFSELGASVIKIENKNSGGDVTRKWKLPSESKEKVSAYYASANYNKESIFLNLKEENEYQEALVLINDADIVISNFKHGDAQKLKLDYKTLQKTNPSIVYGEITGYGQEISRPAFDVVLQAETGFMQMNGTPESGPVKMPVALIDILAAHQLKEGLLCALIKKLKTEKGSFVTVSLFDAAISSLANQATNWLMSGQIPKAIGSQHPNIAPYGDLFITKNNTLIILAIGSNKQFVALCNELQLNKLIKDVRFKENASRVKNRTILNAFLQEKFENKTSEYWIKLLTQKNIPVGEIKNLKTVFENNLAKKMILEENIDGCLTKKVKTVAFNIL